MIKACKIVIGKREGKRPRGIPRRRWKYKIRMDLRKMDRECVDRIKLAQDMGPIVGCCEHGNEPSGSIKDREFLD
jgi:hypothetical protein